MPIHALPDRILVIHRRAALEIASPLEGVWRLRYVPLADLPERDPALPPKQSFAVQERTERPLTLEGQTVVCGQDRLELLEHLRFRAFFGDFLAAEGWGFSGEGGGSSELFQSDHPRTGMRLHAPQNEAYYGLGEKVGPLNKRGLSFTFWNTDVVPHQPDTDPLYQSIPFSLNMREGTAWGLFVDESTRSSVDVARRDPEVLAWQVEGPELECYLIGGPTPAHVLERYTALTGRTPLPPLWALGVHQSRWGYKTERDIKSVIEGYRARDLPLDVMHLDIDYMQGFKVFTFDGNRYPDVKGLSDWALERGVRLVTIVDPGVKQEAGYPVYEQALEGGHLVTTWRGDTFVGEVWPDPAVYPDFSRPAVREWWGDLHRFYLERGIAGIWNDMNEPSCFSVHSPHVDPNKIHGKTLPDDALHGDRTHLEVHNAYALGMAQATYEGMRRLEPHKRPFLLTRAGYAGIQRFSAVWTGDNSSHWEHLELNLHMLLGLGLSGVPFVGSDLGGFAGHSSGELLARWTQVGVFYPFMRNHAAQGTDLQEPWRFGEPFLSVIRDALELRYKLLPHLYTLLLEAEQTGAPPMRPMLWHYPHDPVALTLGDQFLSGAGVLVAPVLRPYHRHRTVYFPSAGWVRLDLLEGGKTYAQGFTVVNAPLEDIPLFLAPGGMLPTVEPRMHTDTARWEKLTLMVNAGASGEYTLLEDDGDGYGERSLTRFTLERNAERVTLRREGPATLEQVLLLGLPQGVSGRGVTYHQTEDGVYVDASGDWEVLTLEF